MGNLIADDHLRVVDSETRLDTCYLLSDKHPYVLDSETR